MMSVMGDRHCNVVMMFDRRNKYMLKFANQSNFLRDVCNAMGKLEEAKDFKCGFIIHRLSFVRIKIDQL